MKRCSLPSLAAVWLLLLGLACPLHLLAVPASGTSACGLCYADGADGARLVVPLESTEVVLDVQPGLLEAQVTQTFTNRTETALEATYLYPLPAEATLTQFELHFRDRVIQSVVREKAQARIEYEVAKAEGKKAALLEQHDPALFSTAVANFLPGETVKVVIRFIQPVALTATAAEIRFPMTTGVKYFPPTAPAGAPGNSAPTPPKVDAASVSEHHYYAFDVEVSGFPECGIQSSSHAIQVEDLAGGRKRVALAEEITIPDRDFVLRIENRPVAEPISTVVLQRVGVDRFGMFTVFPPQERPVDAGAQPPRDYLFLIDHSGSMDGTRMESAKLGVQGCLGMLEPKDRFQIVVFDDEFKMYQHDWVPVSRKAVRKATKYVGRIQSAGGTMMQPALEASLDFCARVKTGRDQVIVFLTDGDVGNETELMQLLERKIGRVRLFTFGVGGAPNAFLIGKMAELGRGQARFISDDATIARELSDLFETLATPVLTDLKLALVDAAGVAVPATFYPGTLSDVFMAKPVQAVFASTGSEPVAVQLEAKRLGKPVSFRLPFNEALSRGDGVAKHFGRKLYEDLAAKRRSVSGDAALNEALGQRMLDTALRFQLVTEMTSRVAIDYVVARKPMVPLPSLTVPQYRAADQAEPATASDENGEFVVLSPFVVAASEDGGYAATGTLAGTRIRTELSDVGSSISVVTSQFLQDTGARSSQDLLVYTTNTEVAGIAGNFLGTTDVADFARRASPQSNTRVRGLSPADNARDFFQTDIPWDVFNVDRSEVQRGANSVLFGLGSPAGLVNCTVAGAFFHDENTLELRYGSYGSLRGSAGFNKVLLPDELALRVAGVEDRSKYQQSPAFNDDRRLFASLRWDPGFLNRGGSHLSVTANFEKGDIDANRPRTTPPVDLATPWFNNASLMALRAAGGINPALANQSSAAHPNDPSAGVTRAGDPNYIPWLNRSPRVFDNVVAVYDRPAATVPQNVITNSTWWDGSNPWTVSNYLGTYADYAQKAGLPGAGDGIYSAKTLANPRFFDFYRNLLDGDNKREWQRFEAFNGHLAQTFCNNRVGYDLAYDRQRYSEGQWAMLSDFAQGITIDPNGWLIRSVDGVQVRNPNFGKAVVISDSTNNREKRTAREAYRASLFGELNVAEVFGASPLTKALGRHVFTALAGVQTTDTRRATWTGAITAPDFAARFHRPGERDIPATDSVRAVATATYLSDVALTTAEGTNLSRLRAVQSPHLSNAWVYDTVGGGWVQAPLEVINQDAGDKSLLYRTADWANEKIESVAVVWQGYLLDATVVPLIGIRQDSVVSRLAQAPTNGAPGRGEALVASPDWKLPEAGAKGHSRQSGTTRSFGLVVHTPRCIAKQLPWGAELSVFANQSANWQPAAGRVDMYGLSLAAPSGKTREFGLNLSALDDRVSLKAAWYRSSVANASLGSFGWQEYMLGYAETWGDEFATAIRHGTYAFSPWSAAQSDAQVLAEQQLVVANWLEHNPLPRREEFFAAWKHSQGGSGQQTPPGMTVTGDTESRGVEFELTAQLSPEWVLTANASRTDATYRNLAGAFVEFVQERQRFYNTVIGHQTWSDGTEHDIRAGDLEFWPATAVAGGVPSGTKSAGNLLVNKWTAEFYGQYRLKRLLEGNTVSELRPWAFNLVTNYTFSRGRLKGFNLGGAYRWQDDYVLGYAYDTTRQEYLLDEPCRGGGEGHLDLWIGYEHKLTEKLTWRIQLNIRNAFEGNKLIPVSVEPRVYEDGMRVRDFEPAASRISERMSWFVTNTFSF